MANNILPYLADCVKYRMDFGVWAIRIEIQEPGRLSRKFYDFEDIPFLAADWVKAVQMLSLIGTFAAVLATNLSLVHLFKVRAADKRKRLAVLIRTISWFASLCIALGMLIVIYHTMYKNHLALVEEALGPLFSVAYIEMLLTLAWGFKLDFLACSVLAVGGFLHVD